MVEGWISSYVRVVDVSCRGGRYKVSNELFTDDERGYRIEEVVGSILGSAFFCRGRGKETHLARTS
jgi:hypothetical protein